MSVMIKLKLPETTANLEAVKRLPGLRGLDLDAAFGLVGIDPRQRLFVVRADQVNDLETRKRLSPEILEAYGDIKIGTTGR